MGLIVVAVGVAFVTAGVAWVFPPAGLVVLGVCLVAAGLFVDFDRGGSENGEPHPTIEGRR